MFEDDSLEIIYKADKKLDKYQAKIIFDIAVCDLLPVDVCRAFLNLKVDSIITLDGNKMKDIANYIATEYNLPSKVLELTYNDVAWHLFNLDDLDFAVAILQTFYVRHLLVEEIQKYTKKMSNRCISRVFDKFLVSTVSNQIHKDYDIKSENLQGFINEAILTYTGYHDDNILEEIEATEYVENMDAAKTVKKMNNF